MSKIYVTPSIVTAHEGQGLDMVIDKQANKVKSSHHHQKNWTSQSIKFFSYLYYHHLRKKKTSPPFIKNPNQQHLASSPHRQRLPSFPAAPRSFLSPAPHKTPLYNPLKKKSDPNSPGPAQHPPFFISLASLIPPILYTRCLSTHTWVGWSRPKVYHPFLCRVAARAVPNWL